MAMMRAKKNRTENNCTWERSLKFHAFFVEKLGFWLCNWRPVSFFALPVHRRILLFFGLRFCFCQVRTALVVSSQALKFGH